MACYASSGAYGPGLVRTDVLEISETVSILRRCRYERRKQQREENRGTPEFYYRLSLSGDYRGLYFHWWEVSSAGSSALYSGVWNRLSSDLVIAGNLAPILHNSSLLILSE